MKYNGCQSRSRVLALMKKINAGILYATFLSLVITGSASAGYVTTGPSLGDYSYFATPTAWNPGADTARTFTAGDPSAPGGATWSIMGVGVSAQLPVDITTGGPVDPHIGTNGLPSTTTAITSLIAGSTFTSMSTLFNNVINVWANPSGFTNLGQVTDDNRNFGVEGSQGDIRIGSIYIDGSSGINTLAHAYQPGNSNIFGSGWDLAGDVHFDNSNTWTDTGGAGVDLFTVALHEFGHSLGLGHSTAAGSVMGGTYTGPLRTLSADDIAGIQSIYGSAVVPLPAAVWLFVSGLIALAGFVRKRTTI